MDPSAVFTLVSIAAVEAVGLSFLATNVSRRHKERNSAESATQAQQAEIQAEIRRREAAEREAEQAREHAAKRQREAEEAAERATQAQHAEMRATKALEEAKKIANHERRLRELGIEPDREITEQEIRNAKLAVGYVANQMNIPVVGRQNEGKSSLINALKGLRPGDPGRAAVGESETTKVPTAFRDERHAGVVWHDIPGGGTSNFSAWGYYYAHKLYAYDQILLVHSSALSELDVRIMQLYVYMKKEYVVARTKADQHIRNCKRNKRHTSVSDAREDFLRQVWEDTNQVTAKTSEMGTLHIKFTDFVISEMGVLQMVNGEPTSEDPYEGIIDEERFLRQLGL